MRENDLSGLVINAAIEVHRTLGGPGLLESTYEEALAYEFHSRSIPFERQEAVPLTYKNHRLDTELRLDLLVMEKLVVEGKATTSSTNRRSSPTSTVSTSTLASSSTSGSDS